jgi:hypothetical protein
MTTSRTPIIADGDKFALIAVQAVDTDVSGEIRLPGGTLVYPSLVQTVDDGWRRWLGEGRIEALEETNLVLIRHRPSQQPQVLDAEHEALGMEVMDMFALLQFSGAAAYQGASLLKGSNEGGHPNIRQFGKLRPFYQPPGMVSVPVTLQRLRAAETRSADWRRIQSSGDFRRFIRGANILMEGLHQYAGQERLIACVRALEALILPDVGRTKNQFVHRCQTFTKANQANMDLLREIYEMRSDIEHVHEWDRSLSAYPVNDREAVAMCRTRQVQILATRQYHRILGDQTIQTVFQSDTSIDAFWQQSDHIRKQTWQDEVDLSAVP